MVEHCTRRQALGILGVTVGVDPNRLGKVGATSNSSMDAVTLRQNEWDKTLDGHSERCLVPGTLLDSSGLSVGSQIRVVPDDSSTPESLCTVAGRTDESGVVELGQSGLDRLDVRNNATASVRSYAPSPDHDTRAAADANDEYVEVLADDGQQSALVACAPHGGWIEHPTDRQSRLVAQTLGVTEWSCAGYNSGGGAYDRWHITSTDIARQSFPELDSIADRAFDHAVSFHGFSGDGIVVGGGASEPLRSAVREAIHAETNSRYEVTLASSDDPYSGDSSENFVNWLTRRDNGVQIEQSWDARSDDWEAIATAVANAYDERI